MSHPIEICPVCGCKLPAISIDSESFEVVLSHLENKTKTLAVAELKFRLDWTEDESRAWLEHLLSCLHPWPQTSRDKEILQLIDQAFGDVQKPDHFTDYGHCEECREHDETLRANCRETIQREALGNTGWDPITFSSEEGIGYYFPALARFALLPAVWENDWYGCQLAGHLSYAGGNNRFLHWCSAEQRTAVYALLKHMSNTRSREITNWGIGEEINLALQVWRDAPDSEPK